MKEGEVWDTKRRVEKRVTKLAEPKPLQLETNYGAIKELLKIIYRLNEDLLRIGDIDDGRKPIKSANYSEGPRTPNRDKKRAHSPRGQDAPRDSPSAMRKQKSKVGQSSSPRGAGGPQTPHREVVFNFMGLDQVK